MTTRTTQPATVTTTRTRAPEEVEEFVEHPARGRFNSAFFRVMGGYINWHMHERKSTAFADLPPTVVELGAGVGANMRYLPVGAHLVAIEPNPYMHKRLRRAARSHGVDLEILSVVGERIDLPDASADAVISSLVLCSVRDPDAVLAEIRRVLRPGGRFSFAEHVAAKRTRRRAGRSGSCVGRGPGSSKAAPANETSRRDPVRRLHQRRPLPLPDPLAVSAVQHPYRRHGHRLAGPLSTGARPRLCGHPGTDGSRCTSTSCPRSPRRSASALVEADHESTPPSRPPSASALPRRRDRRHHPSALPHAR